MSLKSCLYECEVWHERPRPKRHKFKHKHFMFMLSLNELEQIESELKLLGTESRRRLYQFQESDHLPLDSTAQQSLLQRANSAARHLGLQEEIVDISLLTNLRFANYVFNPVSFFFCYGKAENLLCCLAEVGNTFGEKKVYLVKPDEQGRLYSRQKKLFYVSPFTELNQDFLFKLGPPGEHLTISIDTLEADSLVVHAGMSGRRLELSDKNILKLTFQHPFAPLQVIALIHLHALLLWVKKVPFRKKEDLIDQQVAVLHKHKSLTGQPR